MQGDDWTGCQDINKAALKSELKDTGSWEGGGSEPEPAPQWEAGVPALEGWLTTDSGGWVCTRKPRKAQMDGWLKK